MPLSEHEQRQLEQIEQALYREDPKFGRVVRSSDPRVHYKRKLVQAFVGVLAGGGAVAAGVVTHRLWLVEPARRSWCWPWCGRSSAGGGMRPGCGPCGPRSASPGRPSAPAGPGRAGEPG